MKPEVGPSSEGSSNEGSLEKIGDNSASSLQGWVDVIEGFSISGWVLDLDNPLRAVELELTLFGEVISQITPTQERPDVDQMLGFPTRSGYRLSLEDATSDNAAGLLTHIKELSPKQLLFADVVKVRVKGTDFTLPLVAKLKSTELDVESLGHAYDRIVGEAVRNNYITLRDELLNYGKIPTSSVDDVRVVAYYLPQFHPFAENNEWWGEGFTEWTNVVTAKPLFEGHYQPHYPADLGYYDLRLESVQEQQIDLAKSYGLTGFCYYYYWFSGKTLMTLPIDRHLERNYDMDFCLCWANENWSRRWDGSENDVLIGQSHKQEDDVNFIKSCLKYFKSDRYIKINGAPLLQIYRVSLLSDPAETIKRWREIVKAEGFPDLHVSMVESFGLDQPYHYGCDSSSQFPPHGLIGGNHVAEVENINPEFTGNVYSYDEIVRAEIARPAATHRRFRCAMPSWDNTSRKGVNANVFHGSSPRVFETWLAHIIDHSRRHLAEGERIIFINAWNEWAEGAHLEPDRKSGHANLQAVRNALSSPSRAMAQIATAPDLDANAKAYAERLISANKLLNKGLREAYGRYGWQINWTSHFVRCDPTWLKVQRPKMENRAFVDRINGRSPNGVSLLVVGRHQGLVVQGWVNMPHMRLWQSVPFFLSLRPEQEVGGVEMRLIATIHDRNIRDDLTPEVSGHSNYWCGFNITSDITEVPPGRYALELLVADTNSLDTAVAAKTDITLMIG